MADTSPGQIITPGTPNDPPKQSAGSTQEVSVDLSKQSSPSVPLQPSPQVPQSAPSSPSPVPPTNSAPQTVVAPQPQATPPPQAFSDPTSSQQPVEPADGGFAPQFMNTDTSGGDFEGPLMQDDSPDTISWTASEYIAHHKSSSWYVVLAILTLFSAVLVYFITSGDIISIIVIILAALMLGVYAGKKPKEQQYAISPAGVAIGPKVYSFSLLKTFSITDEGAFSSITFWPMKRFMPALSIYYDPKDEDQIVEVLSNYLPMDIQKIDAVDNFMRKIRF